MIFVLGLGTVFAHGPYRLGVHNDNPNLYTSPAKYKKNQLRHQTKNKRVIGTYLLLYNNSYGQ